MPAKSQILSMGIFAIIFSLFPLSKGINQIRKWSNYNQFIITSVVILVSSTLMIINLGKHSNCIKRLGPQANLAGCNFSDYETGNIDLTGAILAGASFENSEFRTVDFTDANLSECDFSGADVTNSTFTDATITGANFSNTTGITDEMLSETLGVSIDLLPMVTNREKILLDSEELMLDTFEQVCFGKGVLTASNYSDTSDYHPYFSLEIYYSEITDQDENIINTDRGSSAVRFTELVGCLEQHQKKIGCGSYIGRAKGGACLLQYEATFVLREAKTGEVVSSKTLLGNLVECPDSISDSYPNTSNDWINVGSKDNPNYLIFGDPVPLELFNEWLIEYSNSQ